MIDIDRGLNKLQFDANVALQAGADKIWFYAKNDHWESDDDAVIKKGLNVSPLSGIAVTDAPGGIFEVTIEEEDIPADVTALVFDCKVKRGSDSDAWQVTRGVLRIGQQVLQSTV